jgi:diketogulonate reductase-like aldo/keto reductase
MSGFVFGKSEKIELPEIGLGTWKMGGSFTADTSRDAVEIKAIRHALSVGYRFIDTAEMYGAGHCEELVGRAISGKKGVLIATKVWQTNLAYDAVIAAAERSLKRLGIETIDLYQIHWPNDAIPLRDTMRAMEKLKDEGKIRHIGVCNFGVELLQDAMSYLSHAEIVTDQVKYNIMDRSAEEELLPFCKKENIGIIAYEPLARQRVLSGSTGKRLKQIASRIGKTETQVALNYIITRGAVPIPKSSDPKHIEENFGATGWRLESRDMETLELIA